MAQRSELVAQTFLFADLSVAKQGRRALSAREAQTLLERADTALSAALLA